MIYYTGITYKVSHNKLVAYSLCHMHAGGGFLQLCLLLIFCLAVLCCASMSITPWGKLDSTLLKRFIAGIWAALGLALDMLFAKFAMTSGEHCPFGLLPYLPPQLRIQ